MRVRQTIQALGLEEISCRQKSLIIFLKKTSWQWSNCDMIFVLGIFGVKWKGDSLWKGGKRNSVKIIRHKIKIVTYELI